VTPWKSRIQFWGISDQGSADMLRGFKMKSARFDEVATYAKLLKHLVQDVMKPALADTGGTLTLAGTPSVTRAGAWFDICCRGFGNFSVHHWDMRQNKKFPRDASLVLAEALADLGGDPMNATYQREWLGLFVDDPLMQVYQYLADRNDAPARPKHYDKALWFHTIAADFGVNDDCAWTVLGSHPHEPVTWGLQSFKRAGLLTDESADVLVKLCAQYEPLKLVGDSGGLGKPYVEEWNRRYAGRKVSGDYALPTMLAAQKQDKRAAIEFVNNELRIPGRVRFVQPDCSPLTEELQSLPWADPQRLKEHPGYPNHCSDSFLYAMRTHDAYLNEAPERRLDPSANTAEYDRWTEQREIEEATQGDWDLY
jgi:hypothetical protein